jgi:hypothetical protein
MASIEDVEMGYRLRRAGHKIMIEKRLLGKHLKKWDFRSLLHTDIVCRAIPWTKLILESRSVPQDLNFRRGHRVSAGLVGLLGVVTLLLSYCLYRSAAASFLPILVAGWLILAGTAVFLNRRVYQFFLQRKGFLFTPAAVGLHFAYYFYSGLVFVLCSLIYRCRFTPTPKFQERL